MIIRTLLEVTAVMLVIYGILHEDKLIEFENSIINKIKSNRKDER